MKQSPNYQKAAEIAKKEAEKVYRFLMDKIEAEEEIIEVDEEINRPRQNHKRSINSDESDNDEEGEGKKIKFNNPMGEHDEEENSSEEDDDGLEMCFDTLGYTKPLELKAIPIDIWYQVNALKVFKCSKVVPYMPTADIIKDNIVHQVIFKQTAFADKKGKFYQMLMNMIDKKLKIEEYTPKKPYFFKVIINHEGTKESVFSTKIKNIFNKKK